MRVGLRVANFAVPGGPPAVLERRAADLVPALRALPVAGRGRPSRCSWA